VARKRVKLDKKEEDIKKAFGKALKQVRLSKGYTQLDLGELADCHFTFISQIERGVRQPTITTIFKLAKILEINPEELVKKARIRHRREISINYDGRMLYGTNLIEFYSILN